MHKREYLVKRIFLNSQNRTSIYETTIYTLFTKIPSAKPSSCNSSRSTSWPYLSPLLLLLLLDLLFAPQAVALASLSPRQLIPRFLFPSSTLRWHGSVTGKVSMSLWLALLLRLRLNSRHSIQTELLLSMTSLQLRLTWKADLRYDTRFNFNFSGKLC